MTEQGVKCTADKDEFVSGIPRAQFRFTPAAGRGERVHRYKHGASRLLKNWYFLK
jgi:hypothetical protein